MTKREAMARLYAVRLRRGACVVCEQPASPYARCPACRGDRAEDAAMRRTTRSLTRWTLLTFSAHPST